MHALMRRFALAATVGSLVLAGCSGARSSPSTLDIVVCNAEQWCWRNPLPQGNLLSTVWGSGASDVWAVGYFGAIVHWNGSAWSGFSTGTTYHLSDIWGSGPSDVWTVGQSGTILERGP